MATVTRNGCIEVVRTYIRGRAYTKSDVSFKFCSAFGCTLMMVFAMVSTINMYSRESGISCRTNEVAGPTRAITDKSFLDAYCLYHGTFLVAKDFDGPESLESMYPGVMNYKKGVDKIYSQKYYAYYWMIFAALAMLSAGPGVAYKVFGGSSCASIIGSEKNGLPGTTEARAKRFANGLGCYRSAFLYFMMCKLLVFVAAASQMFILTSTISRRVLTYGYDVVRELLEGRYSRTSMDMMFPGMAKCEYVSTGYSGDHESMGAICELPLNAIARWTMLAAWFLIVSTAVVNTISILAYLFNGVTGLWRCCWYANLRRVCKPILDDGNVLQLRLGFCDMYMLEMLEKALGDVQFRDMIRSVALTRNSGLTVMAAVNQQVRSRSDIGNEGEASRKKKSDRVKKESVTTKKFKRLPEQ